MPGDTWGARVGSPGETVSLGLRVLVPGVQGTHSVGTRQVLFRTWFLVSRLLHGPRVPPEPLLRHRASLTSITSSTGSSGNYLSCPWCTTFVVVLSGPVVPHPPQVRTLGRTPQVYRLRGPGHVPDPQPPLRCAGWGVPRMSLTLSPHSGVPTGASHAHVPDPCR